MAEHRVDTLEVVHVDHEDGADLVALQRAFDLALQRIAVGQVGQCVMHGDVFGAADRQMLVGDVAGGAADAEHLAVFIACDTGVDADPAVFTAGGGQMGDVILYFALTAQSRQEAAVRHMRTVGLKAEKAASEQVGRCQSENFVGGGIQVGEAAFGIGLPDQVMRSLDEVAIASFTFD